MYSFREIYSQYCKTALKNNEIVLLLTYYEIIDNVRQTLKEIDIDVEKYEKEMALIIDKISQEHILALQRIFCSLINNKRIEVKMVYL